MLKRKIPLALADHDDSKAGVSMRMNPRIVVRAATVHAEALFASTRKLTICSALALSVATTGLSGVVIFGLSTPSHAGSGDPRCETVNAPKSCSEPSSASTRKLHYSLWNDAGMPVVYVLPSGKQYRLGVGQRRSYKNTITSHDLKIYIHNSMKGSSYKLRSGDHKFWRNSQTGRVGFDQNYRTD